MKPNLPLFITILFLAYNILPVASYTQIRAFENILLTTNESINLDLHDYFSGNISSFKVDSPYKITDKTQEMSPQASINSSNIIAVSIPKDIFGNWAPGQDWIFLDNNNTLQFYIQTGDPSHPNLTFSQSVTFLNDSTSTYNCFSMVRLRIDLLAIGCIQHISGLTIKKANYFLVNILQGQLQGSYSETTFVDNVYLDVLVNTDPYLIAYSLTDPSGHISSQITLFGLSSDNPTVLKYMTAGDFNGAPNLYIKGFQISNGIFYVATADGTVYLAEDPLNLTPGFVNSFEVNDAITGLTVVFETYHGQPTTTLVTASTSYIYYYDWTDSLRQAVPINKYPLSPLNTQVQSVNYLEISQDFVSAMVTASNGDCNMAVYYIDQSLPEDIYYMGKCPVNTTLVGSARPLNFFFFLTNNDTTTAVSMFQISRSILQIASVDTGTSTHSLYVNGDAVSLQVHVIDSADYNVYATSTQPTTFGLSIPGISSFDMTNLLSGPFLIYNSNNSAYSILPPVQNVSMVTVPDPNNYTLLINSPSAFYNEAGSDTITWFSFVAANGSTSAAIVAETCVFNQTNYTCTTSASNQDVLNGQSASNLTASDTYLFLTLASSSPSDAEDDNSDANAIFILYHDLTAPDNVTFLAPVNNTDPCTQILASPWPSSPFLYCIGNQSIYIYRVDNLANAQGTGLAVDMSVFKNGLENMTLQLNHNFPSILFVQAGSSIYLLESYALEQSASSVLSTIPVNDSGQGFSFSVGAQSLIVYIPFSETLIEYDISHPYNPILLKTLLTVGYSVDQILGESTYSDNIYLYGLNIESGVPSTLIYRPRMTANSNYLTSISLPLSLFDPSQVKTYPRYPVIPQSQGELLVMPVDDSFGWFSNAKAQIYFYAPNFNDTDATDYEDYVPVTITGTHVENPISSSVAIVTFDLVLTNEKVKAPETIYYDPTITFAAGLNVLNVDPRNHFNGYIQDYIINASNSSDQHLINFTQQSYERDPLNFTDEAVNLNSLEIINGTFVGQSSNSFYFFNGTQGSQPISYQNLTYYNFTYNSYRQMILSLCTDTYGEVYLEIMHCSGLIFKQLSAVATSTAGRNITNVQKFEFTNHSVFILEDIANFGSFIHVFSFSDSGEFEYLDSISSGNLNTNFLTLTDFTVNYRGSSSEYRLFMIDPNYGLRTLDVTFTRTVTFSNALVMPLQGPSNVVWNGIITVFENMDLSGPIDLVVTSYSYKSYFLQYTPGRGLSVKWELIAYPNTNIIRPCYADRQNYILSACENGTYYALLYTITNISSTATGQNFPLLSVPYVPAAPGSCSFSFNATDIAGPSLYASQAPQLSNYSVSPNLTMSFTGVLSSQYIVITGFGLDPANNDSFNYYLVPPPGPPNKSLLFVYLIVGGVALLITIVLICYCTIKCRKRRIEQESCYENMSDSEVVKA